MTPQVRPGVLPLAGALRDDRCPCAADLSSARTAAISNASASAVQLLGRSIELLNLRTVSSPNPSAEGRRNIIRWH
jgi:hypothetical protein